MRHLGLATLLVGVGPAIANAQWQQQTIATKADFRGLCVVNSKIAWVSGTKGTVGRTADGGATWSVGTVPDAEKLDFRDVEAFGATTAYLLMLASAKTLGSTRLRTAAERGRCNSRTSTAKPSSMPSRSGTRKTGLPSATP